MTVLRKLLVGTSLLASAFSTSASAEWLRAISDHFVVYSEGSERSLRDFTLKLERFDALLHHVLKIEQRDEHAPRVTIFLVDNTTAVRKAMGGTSKSVAGYYTATPGGALAVMPRSIGIGSKYNLDTEALLQHEYAHHFMLHYFPGIYPAWYVEGFAEFYSTAQPLDEGRANVGKPAMHRFYGLATLKPMASETLLNTPTVAFANGEDMERFYGQSWLLTHYLYFSKERLGQLRKYLDAINKGTTLTEAAVNAFGPLDVLDKDLAAYKKAPRLSYLQITGFSRTTPEIQIETLTGAEGALVLHKLQWMQDVHEEERPAFAAEVEAIAKRFPGDPAVLELRAQIALADERLDDAQEANEAFLAHRPKDTRGLLRRAEIAIARLEARDEPATAADWKAMRVLIAQANRANPNDPLPLLAYYRAYQSEGVAPPKLAVDGLSRALQLSPQSDEIRFLLAYQLFGDKEFDAARHVIEPIAYAPHENGGRSGALELIQMITTETAKANASTAAADAATQAVSKASVE